MSIKHEDGTTQVYTPYGWITRNSPAEREFTRALNDLLSMDQSDAVKVDQARKNVIVLWRIAKYGDTP